MAKKIKKEKVVDGKENPKVIEVKVAEQAKVAEQVKVTKNIHGGKANVRSIDELLGRTSNPYSVGNAEDYEKSLKNLTLADLQKHATEVGLLPVTNIKVLVTRLVEQYKKTARGYYNTKTFNTVEPKNPEQLLKILKAGAN